MPSMRKTKHVIIDKDKEDMEKVERDKKTVFIKKDPTQWLFIANDDVRKQDPNIQNKPVVCELRHPRTDKKSLFLFSNEDKNIYEITQFKEGYRSWFIGESVQYDGSLYITTPVDPVFLLLPYLVKSAQCGKFMKLDQIVIDEDYPECHRLQCCCQTDHLDHVADVKGDDDLKVYRYNKEKTLSWLKLKTECVSRVLERKNVCVSGATTLELIRRTEPAEYMKYAFGIVSEYLLSELGSSLREYLGIPVVAEKRTSDAKNPPSKRVKLEDIKPSEDYSVNIKQDDKSNKGKQSNAQKKLGKVDKTGMKSMMSFFSPKTKT